MNQEEQDAEETKYSLADIFLRAPGARPGSVLLCVCLAGFLNMASMGAILPVIGEIGGDSVSSDSQLNKVFQDVFNAVGIKPTLGNLCLIIAGLLSAKAMMTMLAMSYVSASVARVQAEIRMLLLKNVLAARWRYFINQAPGRLSNSMSVQSMMAGEAFYSTSQVIVSGIQAFALVAAATLISGWMILLTAVAAAFVSYPMYRLVVMAREAGEQQWKRTSQLGSHVQNTINNMKPIKAMGRGQPFNQLFASLVEQLYQAYYRMMLSRHALGQGQDILLAITVTSGFYIGSVVFDAKLADLIVLGIIYYQVVALIKKMQEQLQIASLQQAAFNGVMRLADRASDANESWTGTLQPNLTSGIKLARIDFSYADKPTLKSIDIEVDAGDVTVLYGKSGSGKTTLVDLITGLIKPSSGEVLIDGVSLAEIDVHGWRSMIGYVPQELTLLHGDVRQNLSLGDNAIDDGDIWQALDMAGASEFVQELEKGLDTHIGNMGARLSGGQRQRLSLARALVRKPSLLICDEATSALDKETEAEICSKIASLRRHCTIIAITHREAWKQIADRLYSVEAGMARRQSTDSNRGRPSIKQETLRE
ncbi:MAG: ABC transporter ATP-binding protein [Anderseniella sp.]